jgi:hypothetical protein
MSLEIRVETLEHELKILKSEIENTLLEIQNQILIHYYPALRAENSAPPKDLSALLASSPPDRGDEAKEKRNGSHPAPGDDEDAPPAIKPPKTREVSLSEIGARPRHVPLPSAMSRKGASYGPETVIDRVAFTHLARWVSEEENPPEQVETKELMDVLLKLNKVLHQIGQTAETTAGVKERSVG